jgi:DNA polymerase-3 subunit alpha
LRAPDPSPDGDFVHLHVHSEFNLLDGLSRIGEMTQRVADQGMTAKPIIGLEAYISSRGMTQNEGKQDADYHHMILLAKDDVGYRNLLALTTQAHLEGYYYEPRIDKELLAKHSASPYDKCGGPAAQLSMLERGRISTLVIHCVGRICG